MSKAKEDTIRVEVVVHYPGGSYTVPMKLVAWATEGSGQAVPDKVKASLPRASRRAYHVPLYKLMPPFTDDTALNEVRAALCRCQEQMEEV